jgi:hypothetical protein
MATALFSKEGKYRVIIREVPNGIDDGSSYKIDVTGRIFKSQNGAVRNARRWLKKKRDRYYKKHPNERVRIKVKRLIPKSDRKPKLKQINKLYKMNKDVAKILVRMSDNALKIHLDYTRKKFENEKTTAVSGETENFNKAIYTVMVDGTKKERKLVAKMMKKFTHEPFRNTNMFY